MSQLVSGICWAAIIVALALANKFGLIADKDAAVMFAIVPAIWIATTYPRRGCRRRAKV